MSSYIIIHEAINLYCTNCVQQMHHDEIKMRLFETFIKDSIKLFLSLGHRE